MGPTKGERAGVYKCRSIGRSVERGLFYSRLSSERVTLTKAKGHFALFSCSSVLFPLLKAFTLSPPPSTRFGVGTRVYASLLKYGVLPCSIPACSLKFLRSMMWWGSLHRKQNHHPSFNRHPAPSPAQNGRKEVVRVDTRVPVCVVLLLTHTHARFEKGECDLIKTLPLHSIY